MRELVDRPDRLDARIHAVRAALAASAGRPPDAIDHRVATSVAQLGLVARVLAPIIGAAAFGSGCADDPGDIWWQDQLGGPFPLSTAGPGPGPSAVSLPGSLVDLLTTATAERFPIAPRVLWGNVASAANSAARLVAAGRPDLATAAHGAANAILADPRVEDGQLRSGSSFRRRSCCLIYRLSEAPGSVCGDCVLKP